MASLSSVVEVIFALSIALVLFVVVQRICDRSRRKPFNPPGPPPLPFIGNVHQLPSVSPERKFQEWSQKYGDVIYLKIFGSSTIVLNSVQASRDLLEKRSANYSDRPSLPLHYMMGWDCIVSHFTYGERFRKHRKWIQAGFQDKEMLRSYLPIQYREACTLLMSIIEAPEAFEQHIHRYAAATLTEITYGHKVTGPDDEIVALADIATRETVRAGSPGANPLALLIQFFPILQHYPLWLPGSGFKVKANEIRGYVKAMIDTPYNMVKESFATGKVIPCFTAALLEEHLAKNSLSKADEIDIKGAAVVLYGAGTDTSFAIMTSFILAMEEMDGVVGTDRLPDVEDWRSLPYLGCIYRETLRWVSPAPLAIPHMCTKSDVYRGWKIPEGSTVIPNVWGMLHDPQMYPDPERFSPERYEGLDESQLEATDPRNIVFGFGRRRCPGEMFVERSIYVMMSYVIATMEISRARDEGGNEIVPPADFHPGFVIHPKEFLCSMRPRSKKAAAMIKQMNTLS